MEDPINFSNSLSVAVRRSDEDTVAPEPSCVAPECRFWRDDQGFSASIPWWQPRCYWAIYVLCGHRCYL